MKKLFLFIFILGFIGCKTPTQTIDEVIPALDEENNLLFESVPLNLARKSATKEDYTIKENC